MRRSTVGRNGERIEVSIPLISLRTIPESRLVYICPERGFFRLTRLPTLFRSSSEYCILRYVIMHTLPVNLYVKKHNLRVRLSVDKVGDLCDTG